MELADLVGLDVWFALVESKSHLTSIDCLMSRVNFFFKIFGPESPGPQVEDLNEFSK